MRVYGHRGYAAAHPHNSLAGVVAAFAAGADGVEVDVRRAPDGTLVLSNPPVSSADGLPTLESVLAVAAGRVICEVKSRPGEPDFDAPYEATTRLLVALLAARPDADVVVSSFDWYAIGLARDAGLRTAFVTPPRLALDGALAYAADAGHPECHPHWTAVLEDVGAVAAARERGVDVVPWGVPDLAAFDRLRDAGVAGVIADDVRLHHD